MSKSLHVRYPQFVKALQMLEQATDMAALNDLELEGMVQRFEYTFELSWKVMKDILRDQGIDAASPREIIKEAFRTGLIDSGELWLEMLDQRNLMSHTYDEENFRNAVDLIKKQYIQLIKNLDQKIKSNLNA